MTFMNYENEHLIDHSPIDLSGAAITPSSSLRDLGVLLSSDMSMTVHVNKVVSECFYKLRQIINTCRRCMPVKAYMLRHL